MKVGFILKANKTSKIIGAMIASLIFVLPLLAIIISLFYLSSNIKIIFIPVIVLGLLAAGMIYNLIMRIKEILGGEEDEASKY